MNSTILFVYMCLVVNVSNLMDESSEIDARTLDFQIAFVLVWFFASLIVCEGE